jgi:hypothetical protein
LSLPVGNSLGIELPSLAGQSALESPFLGALLICQESAERPLTGC